MTQTYILDGGTIIRSDGQRMAFIQQAQFGDGALPSKEFGEFRVEVVTKLNAFSDMLAALEEAVKAFRAAIQFDDDDEIKADDKKIIGRMEAAIAKARGEAPHLCNGCQRPELDCSDDPCPDVIADREA